MRVLRLVFLAVWLAECTLGGGEVLEYLNVDGQRYESVKWGPVNQGKVVIFHSRGVAYIPLEKLPPEYQARFGYNPEKTATTPTPAPETIPSQPQKISKVPRAKRSESQSQDSGDWPAYSRDRVTKVLLDGKLVDRSTLKTLTGFLVKETVQVTVDQRTLRGAMLELAQRREDLDHVSSSMELRPALWKGTGEHVILANYTPSGIAGALLRVFVVEDPPIDSHRVFRVGTEPTFEQWQESVRRN